MSLRTSLGVIAVAGIGALAACVSQPAQTKQLSAAPCVSPPVMRCVRGEDCGALVTEQGPAVEPQSGRNYFLDYPCDLKEGEDVTLILSLHGGGSYGNWQRHYFPIVDYVDSHRLVIATPNTRGWSQADDGYLQAIAQNMIDEVGAENVKSFWLVGHSMGSFNSRRLICSDYFRDKADGYMSLSGGRVGNPPDAPAPRFDIPPTNGSDPNARRVVTGPPPGAGAGSGGPPPGAGPFGAIARAQAANLDCDFSFIYAGGGHEPSAIALSETSSWAEHYGCRARELEEVVEDARGGYVHDPSRQEFGNDAWGRLPGPGSARVMTYANCQDGRIVADVIRDGKGHTEGLEPEVTKTLVEMMQSARGGKLSAT